MFAWLMLFACNSGPTWYADVKPIVDAHCADCHSDGGVAPFVLNDLESVSGLGEAVKGAVQSRQMPPYYAEKGHTPLKFDSSLTDAQIQLIADWVDSGFPEGRASQEGEPIVLPRGGLSDFTVEKQLASPYQTVLEPDEYRCFVFDWDGTEDTYVTGVEMLPDNPAINHHAVVYAIPPYSAFRLEDFDAWDEGPGYGCFGSAQHPDYEPESLTDQFLQVYVGAWTPGVQALEFNNGVLLEPGSKLVMQMHYYTGQSPEALDQSGFRLKTSSSVEAEAYYMPWMNITWPIGSMPIPVSDTRTVHEFQADPTEAFNIEIFAGEQDWSTGMLLHSVFAHMHVLGRRIVYTLHRADGTKQVLLDVPRYDFDCQREYVFAEPVLVMPGDELQVECEYDNSAAWNAELGITEPVDANWGEGTFDEMCVAHTRVTHP